MSKQVIGKKLKLMDVPAATGEVQQLVITPQGNVEKKPMSNAPQLKPSVGFIRSIKKYYNSQGELVCRLLCNFNPFRSYQELAENTKLEIYNEGFDGQPGYWSQYSIPGFEFKGEMPFDLPGETLVRLVTYDDSYAPTNVYQLERTPTPDGYITSNLVVIDHPNEPSKLVITFTLNPNLASSVADIRKNIYIKAQVTNTSVPEYSELISLDNAIIYPSVEGCKVFLTLNTYPYPEYEGYQHANFSVHDGLGRYNSSVLYVMPII